MSLRGLKKKLENRAKILEWSTFLPYLVPLGMIAADKVSALRIPEEVQAYTLLAAPVLTLALMTGAFATNVTKNAMLGTEQYNSKSIYTGRREITALKAGTGIASLALVILGGMEGTGVLDPPRLLENIITFSPIFFSFGIPTGFLSYKALKNLNNFFRDSKPVTKSDVVGMVKSSKKTLSSIPNRIANGRQRLMELVDDPKETLSKALEGSKDVLREKLHDIRNTSRDVMALPWGILQGTLAVGGAEVLIKYWDSISSLSDKEMDIVLGTVFAGIGLYLLELALVTHGTQKEILEAARSG